jgi:phosphopantothenate-cysteine ligase
VADLEQRAVRSLDNFSTGLRGALSVEEFLRRGYAVVHLKRQGSASPYGRVLAQALGQSPQDGIAAASLDKLLDNADETDTKTTAEEEEDPWLTTVKPSKASTNPRTTDVSDGSLQLHRRLCHDEHLQRAWREWRSSRDRLFTIDFRTVEEYLDRLHECATALHDAGALAMVYLAAAVSDYYVADKVEHKIQSDDNELVLRLQPVPKVLGLLRTKWAPKAFCVSFKLETDFALLQQKAERAVSKYGVHMVVGNILETRHQIVYVLHPPRTIDNSTPPNPSEWTLKEVSKTLTQVLESELIDFCVEQHFRFISQHLDIAHAALHTNAQLLKKKKQLQREMMWKSLKEGALSTGGTLLGMAITYLISSAIQQRILHAR